jgi:ABC-type glycerol-3-phosphate transport system permease component
MPVLDQARKSQPFPGKRGIHLTSAQKRRIVNAVIITLLLFYSVLTLFPFYLLFVRSFVPTTQATKLWLWIPPFEEVNMDAQVVSYAAAFNVEITRIRKALGIEEYLRPNMTLREMASHYDIPEEKIKDFFRPYVNYSGWMFVITSNKFLRSTLATAYVVSVSVIVGGFLSCATGSVLARFRKRYHLVIYRMYILETIIPPMMIILPLYIIMTRFLHLQNRYLSLILFYIKGGAVPTLLFTTFISTIPRELKESVYIDGGNRHHYFFRILLPLTKTPFAAYFAMRIPKYWNDVLFGFVFLNPEKYTLVPLLASLSGEYTTNFQALYSGLCLSVIPLLILYLIFNKLFVGAQLAGALKA